MLQNTITRHQRFYGNQKEWEIYETYNSILAVKHLEIIESCFLSEHHSFGNMYSTTKYSRQLKNNQSFLPQSHRTAQESCPHARQRL